MAQHVLKSGAPSGGVRIQDPGAHLKIDVRRIVRTDADGRSFIAGHYPCVDCGYDLFGANAKGVCSECGGSISESIKAAQLGWQRSDRVVYGTIVCFAGILLCGVGAAIVRDRCVTTSLAILGVWLFFISFVLANHFVAGSPPSALKSESDRLIVNIAQWLNGVMLCLVASVAMLVLWLSVAR